MKKIKKVLVLNHQGIGNVIENIPLIASIKKGIPDAEIWSTISSEQVKNLISNLNIVDNFYILGPHHAGIKRLPHILKLRKQEFDLLISTPGSSTLISSVWAICLGAGMSIGENGGWRTFALKKTINPLSEKSFADLGRQMVSELGLKPVLETPNLIISPNELKRAEKWISDNYENDGRLFVFHPGCDAKNTFKRWPANHFRELWTILKEKYKKSNLLVIGSPEEEELVKDILPNETSCEKCLFGELPLRDVLSIVSKADVLVSGDSGWMHLAAAVNVPRVSIFGGTSVDRCRPDSKEKQRIITVDCPHSPCYPDPCDQPCLSKISAAEVAKEVINITDEFYKE